jgi:hypothetical protein
VCKPTVISNQDKVKLARSKVEMICNGANPEPGRPVLARMYRSLMLLAERERAQYVRTMADQEQETRRLQRALDESSPRDSANDVRCAVCLQHFPSLFHGGSVENYLCFGLSPCLASPLSSNEAVTLYMLTAAVMPRGMLGHAPPCRGSERREDESERCKNESATR